jgi:hypothetical protein
MAAHGAGGQRLPDPRLTLVRARAVWRRAWLDAALCDGADPHSSRELSLRAAQLTQASRRARLAADLERAVAAEGPRRGAAIPVCRSAVREAREELLALARELVERQRPAPRGVALTMRLLIRGDGPLYLPDSPGDLVAAARSARDAL